MSTSPSSLSRSQLVVDDPQLGSEVSVNPTNDVRWNESKKSPYQVDQQVKFLHLEAEVETLLQQLQTIQQQRLAPNSKNAAELEK
jgi:hypothetical protein